MFEVEPNLWLQSFAGPWLTAAMQAVTFFGYDWLYAAAVIGLGFGLRLRPMLGVMLALLLAGLCTHAAKDGLQLPRPVQVDARVLDKGEANHEWQVEHGGATAFLALPSAAAIASQRAAPDPDFGFISGHVAAATALCAGLWLFFGARGRWQRAGLLLWPALMALSRMYLGRHFLADVLAGAATGGLAGLAASLLWRPGRPQRLLAALAVTTCLAAIWLPFIDRHLAGQLLGLALTGVVLFPRDWPAEGGPWWKHLARVAVAFAVYALFKEVLSRLAEAAHWPENSLMSVPLAALGVLSMMLGGIWVCRRLRLYPQAGCQARSG